jgi:hypothetical protein
MNSGLCWRCEHRAIFHERGKSSRYECGKWTSVISCYMFQPVKPIILKRVKDDKRPMFAGWGVSARVHRSEKDADMELTVRKAKDGYQLYWTHKNKGRI